VIHYPFLNLSAGPPQVLQSLGRSAPRPPSLDSLPSPQSLCRSTPPPSISPQSTLSPISRQVHPRSSNLSAGLPHVLQSPRPSISRQSTLSPISLQVYPTSSNFSAVYTVNPALLPSSFVWLHISLFKEIINKYFSQGKCEFMKILFVLFLGKIKIITL
jgi:hypothetical protein